MSARDQARDSTAIDIVKLGGTLAALSVLIVFLVSFGSAIFARGLLISLGFPSSTIGVKAAADMFAVISYRKCLIFLLCGLLGFIPWDLDWLPDRLRLALSLGTIICVMIVVRIEIMSNSPFGRPFFELTTSVAPATVGFSLISVKSVVRYPLAMFASLVVLLAFGVNIRSIAVLEADQIKQAGINEYIVSVDSGAGKPVNDFAIVTMIAKESLGFLAGGVKVDGGCEYAPQPAAFLRLIAEDDSRYFLIEKTDRDIVPFTVRKEAIIALTFKDGSVTSGKAP
jgi:hypothetical protein